MYNMTINKSSDTVEVTNTCPFCGKTQTLSFAKDEFLKGLNAREHGALIQDAWPSYTPTQREFLLTGICDDCWKTL